MKRDLGKLAAAAALSAAMIATGPASAQKQGGILRAGHFDSPASMSMLEESTLAVNRPMMGVFNNLVMFDQQVAQNSPQSIVPDLATGWSWNEEGTELTCRCAAASSGTTANRQRRQMHLGSVGRHRERQASHQPAQILVRQCR